MELSVRLHFTRGKQPDLDESTSSSRRHGMPFMSPLLTDGIPDLRCSGCEIIALLFQVALFYFILFPLPRGTTESFAHGRNLTQNVHTAVLQPGFQREKVVLALHIGV